jgi:hypothetical protein
MWTEYRIKKMKKVARNEQRAVDPLIIIKSKKKNNAVPVTGRGGPWGCETSRIPHSLGNRLSWL